MDAALVETIHSFQETVNALPFAIGDLFKPITSGWNAFFGSSSLDFAHLIEKTKVLTEGFSGLADQLSKIKFPSVAGSRFDNRDVADNKVTLGETINHVFLKPISFKINDSDQRKSLNKPMLALNPPDKTDHKKDHDDGIIDVEFTVKNIASRDVGTFGSAVKNFGSSINSFVGRRSSTAPTPPGPTGSGAQGAPPNGGGGNSSHSASNSASVLASLLTRLPGAFMAVEGEVENLRRSALAANAVNQKYALYNGQLFGEMVRFQFGQFMRNREIAHGTSASSTLLAHRVNEMENAFTPFDIMRQDIANKVGIVKANIAKGFADTILTPIANVYNFLGKMKGSNNPLTSGLATVGGIAGPALMGAALGSRFGPWGTAAGALAGGIAGGLGVDADEASRIFTKAAGWGTWGAGIGAILGSFIPGLGTMVGAGIGGFIGMTAGAIKAAVFDQKTEDLINDGPWMEFLRTSKTMPALRPPMNVPKVPNRFHP